MPKLKYLVGRPGDQKFKRNVPIELQQLAGKTAFVERARSSKAIDLKQQANLFAVKTDAALRQLKLQAGHRPQTRSLSVLTDEEARHYAVAYYTARHNENVLRGDYFADPDEPGFTDLLSDAGDQWAWAIRAASGEMRMTEHRATKLLCDYGVLPVSPGDEVELPSPPASLKSDRGFQLFCRMIERADLILAERRYDALQSGKLKPEQDELFGSAAASFRVHAAPELAKAKTIDDLKVHFMHQRGGSVTLSRQAQYRLPFRYLEEELGGQFALNRLTRERCRNLLELLPTIPAHATQHYKGSTLLQAAELHEQKTGSKAARYDEAKKHAQVLNSAFELAVQEGWLDKNPWHGLAVVVPRGYRKKHESREQTYEPFTVNHLNAIFALPLFRGCVDDEHGCHTPGPNIVRRHRYWAPILALWTGMRMNEILQLERADISMSPDGIEFIRVTDQDHGDYSGTAFSKRLKTKNAVRSIPIHHTLKAIGFLTWVQDCRDGRLFPEATVGKAGEKPSDTYSKRFASNLKEAGVWKPRRLVFHSFRNSFNDALRSAGVDIELREAIKAVTSGSGIKLAKCPSQKLSALSNGGIIPLCRRVEISVHSQYRVAIFF